MVKHCAFGTCNSDTRKLKRDPNNSIFFIPFPKPHLDLKKCRKWIIACKREHFGQSNITKDTYICNLYFVGANGPTLLNPDPISATQTKVNILKYYNTFKKNLMSI